MRKKGSRQKAKYFAFAEKRSAGKSETKRNENRNGAQPLRKQRLSGSETKRNEAKQNQGEPKRTKRTLIVRFVRYARNGFTQTETLPHGITASGLRKGAKTRCEKKSIARLPGCQGGDENESANDSPSDLRMEPAPMKKGQRLTRRETTRQAALLDLWRKSPEWRALARKGAYIAHRKLAARPRCGAKTRTTGAPCQAPAMENGRCYRHGGRVPKGNAWHRPTYPLQADRFSAKIATLQRRAEKRAARVAKMTPEELELHKRWHETHKPGSVNERARRREERRQAAEARAMFSRPPIEPEPSAEERELMARIEQLRALAKELELRASAEREGLFD